jgi:hypothetical protein
MPSKHSSTLLKVVIKINRHRWGSVGLRGLSCALLQIVEDVGHYLEAPSAIAIKPRAFQPDRSHW